MASTKKLVIVESPTKMQSIQSYLGDGYEVLSSVGHIRDLPEPREMPAEMKKGPFGRFAVNVDDGFEPYYELSSDRARRTVTELKRALKNADELLLATDEDREGEAIAWHLREVLKPKVPVKRMVFHEITKDAILAAVEQTRELDLNLVDAQETRRILDRLFGFEVSPVLWRKVSQGLSAGRVQSPAIRLIVERERERIAFVSASYWDISTLAVASASSFPARLARVDGRGIARGADFDDTGALKRDVVALDEAAARALAAALETASTATVHAVEAKPQTRRPAAPFTTSTLQQEASRKLGFTSKQTMSVAQSLYEHGYITYMRTDSSSLSTQAITAARAQAVELYGADSIPDKPRSYASKSKNAQEAHEAIRPSGEHFRTPASLAGSLHGGEARLYDLIWKRTVASQMADAKVETTTVTLRASANGQEVDFTASGTVVTFPGFLAAYEEGKDEKRGDADKDDDVKLPALRVGAEVQLTELEPKGHATTPRARYTEATLVKALEEKGIGRPSTFSSIIDTILGRYVNKRGQALVPNWKAFSVVKLLEDHFGKLVQYDFTAEMENDLDEIARGERGRVDWLHDWYFGADDEHGLRGIIDNLGDIDAREINSIPITEGITLRVGKYGPFLEVADLSDPEAKPRNVNVPEELAPDELTPEKARELADAPVITDRVLGENPETGKIVLVKKGRFGPYVTEADPEVPVAVDPATGEVLASAQAGASTAPAAAAAVAGAEPADDPDAKPAARKRAPAKKKEAAPKERTASLFKDMSPEEVDLDTALKLLDLPRVVGDDPESGEPIRAQNGRYGPYLTKGADTRSLEAESQIFSIDLAGALELFAQPKYGARKASSALKEFEADPVSGKPIRVRDGRFGPYVTDGTTNVTIPRGEQPEDITFERAVQMLADKRAKPPATKKAPAKKAPAKKAPAKKAPAKATAAKTTTAAAKKPAAAKPATKAAAAKKPAEAAGDAVPEATAE
ncbi:MAG: type I DNA topoisomerase [Microbacteriaceae bacterium]